MPHPIYRLTETSPPGAEPLTLEETKIFLRVDHDSDDAQISALISAARQACENATGRSLIARGYSLFLDFWPALALNLPKPPLLSVTRINVYAADNTTTEFPATDYFTDTAGLPGRIVLQRGVSPPSPGRVASGIEIQFKAGYGSAPQSVPASLRQGMKQMVAHLYENRGDSPEQTLQISGAAVLFQPYRIARLS